MESVYCVIAGGLQHAADLRDVCVEVGAEFCCSSS